MKTSSGENTTFGGGFNLAGQFQADWLPQIKSNTIEIISSRKYQRTVCCKKITNNEREWEHKRVWWAVERNWDVNSGRINSFSND